METAKATLAHYIVDAKASRLTVQAFATGILSAVGHNPTLGIGNFNGDVHFSSEVLQGSGFHLSVRAASLSVQDDVSDKDRREIERLMNESGMTYRGLAAKTELSAGYLNHLVHGNRPVPSNSVIDRLAGTVSIGPSPASTAVPPSPSRERWM